MSIGSTTVYNTKNAASEIIFKTGKIDQGIYGKNDATAAKIACYSELSFKDLEKQAIGGDIVDNFSTSE